MTPGSCVVTGAAGGLGRGIVDLLLESGWSVVGLDLHDSTPHSDAHGDNFISVVGDVAEPGAHADASAAAEAVAPLTGWVNCAGYNILGSVAELSEADLLRGVSVNLLGVFHGTATACRAMLAAGGDTPHGSIINISSIQASVGFPGFAAYAMTKGGIESLTRQVAAEYVSAGIRCNAVAPGLIESPMNAALLAESADPAALRSAWRQLTPMGRWGTARDVAAAVVFLLGEGSSYITGEVLAVNGGALTIAPGQVTT